jgi:hypothetical protein
MHGETEDPMLIDCDRCTMRDIACTDCVVTVLLGPPGAARPGFDDDEEAALEVLADSGLVPPLRLTLVDTGTKPPRIQRTA